MSLTIARKGRSFLAKIVWWRDNFVGVAFSSDSPYELPVSDIEERLRKSEEEAPAAAPHQRTCGRRLKASDARASETPAFTPERNRPSAD